ncbi:MAG: glycosyltransferase family 1 protein, partial [Gammaproteobacteria bacterium]|nr:glycosyltransferase family 1 protein [Gammaproteobacteria bacterium]
MVRVVVIGSLPQSLLNFRGPLLKSMVDRGHEVHALSPPAQTEVVDGLAAIGVRHHAYPLVRTGLNPLQDLGTGRALVQIVRGLQPDCLLAYTVKAVIYGGLAARIARVPRYYALISGLGYTFSGKGIKSRLVGALVRPLYRFSLSHAAHVFFQNADNLEVFESAGLLAGSEQAVLVNGSGVDLTHFAPVPLPSEPAFLMVGRLLREKGVLEYVAAARAVKARHPDAVFRLAGWIDPHPDAIKQADLDAWIEEGVIEFLG